MNWDLAAKTAAKMLLAGLIGSIPAIVLIAVGFGMMGAGTADSIFEADSKGLIYAGVALLIVGYIGIYVVIIAVSLKYFSEAVRDLLDPTLSDMSHKVNFVHQSIARGSAAVRTEPQGSTVGSNPDDPWARPQADPSNT